LTEFLDIVLAASFWAAALRIATPLIFGTLGALLGERSGVLNLGIEGIMTAGAMTGWLAVYLGAPLWMGLLAAACVGALVGLLHAGLTVQLGLSQHVAGLGITLFASSLSWYIYRLSVPSSGSPPKITPFAPVHFPVLSDLSWIGEALFRHTAPTWLALVLVAGVAWGLWRTPLGLALRMAGESPQACEAQGVSVFGLRTGALMAGSALMAVGGAFLTTAAFDSFYFTMIQGRGWICIALVVFASWQPGKALLGAILYGMFDAFQLRLQPLVPEIPYQLFLMMPYLLSIAALVLVSRRASVPQALMVPYRKGER
jgi:simple sugar transport system permease protein